MSLRPRREKKPTVNNFGSILGPAIDLKPVQDVGIKLINNTKPGAYFVTEMYFGPIGADDIMVRSEDYPGQRYLRFRLNLLGSRSGRRSFAARIETGMKPLLGPEFGDAKHTDSYVCGSPANSFYVVCFPETSASTSTFELDPMVLAKAITGASPGDPFVIDTDGFKYSYAITGQDPKFSMVVTRQS